MAAPLLAAVVAACAGASQEEPTILRVKERMEGRALVVELVCESAPYENAFLDHVVRRLAEDEARYPAFDTYRFRLSLIPEDVPGGEPVSVLFSYIFFDRDAKRTSDVEAFEFLMSRLDASAIVAAGNTSARWLLYEALREQQPELNPEFARRLPPRPGRELEL